MPTAPRFPQCDVSVDVLVRDHHDEIAAMRRTGALVWVPALDGWVVTTREIAVAVMRDAVTFTVDDPRFSTAQVIGPSMLSLDGAAHARHRDPFAAAYRPAEVVGRYGERIVAVATELVDAPAPRGRAELRRELAGPLAVAVVAMSLGLDDLRTDDLLGWYDRIVAAVEAVSQGSAVDPDALDAFAELGVALNAAVRRDGSVLEDAAAVLSAAEMVSNAAVFLFGGIETSEGMTANVLAHVIADPVQLAAVAADRSRLDGAVEESLRLEPAAARVDRYATRDIEIGGAAVRAGDLVIVSLSAANRDPAVYADPDRFDVDRANARSHLAFAQGPHACIGAQLARMQTRAAMSAVLDRLPGIALALPVTTQGLVFRKPHTVAATWPAGGIDISFVAADSVDAQWAMSQYFNELDRRFDDRFDAAGALAEAVTSYEPPHGLFVVARRDGVVVGCGAVHFLDDETAEVKRMWVDPAARGLGLGTRLLAHLEWLASMAGRVRTVLDTNSALVEPVAMYESAGYRAIERYNDNPHAQRWFEKVVAPEPN